MYFMQVSSCICLHMYMLTTVVKSYYRITVGNDSAVNNIIEDQAADNSNLESRANTFI